MRKRTRRIGIVGACWLLGLAAPAAAQYREYYLRGRVLDAHKNPIPGVEIRLRDVSTSRSYNMKTGKDGAFKLAGLPRGTYEVAVVKSGYTTKRDEWKFETPQETMQRVEVGDVILASEAQPEEPQPLAHPVAGTEAAREKLRQGDFDGALALLQGVLAATPDDVPALFLAGMSHAGKKMHREAVAELTRVTELSPSFAGAQLELGVCYRQLGELPRALTSYEKAMELDTGNMLAVYNSGLILFETNRIDEALARFERALVLAPEDVDVLEMAARCNIHQGDFQAAVQHLEKARASNSDPAKAARLDELLRMARAQIH